MLLARPKLKKYFSETDVNNILTTIHNHAEFINVKSKVNVCRDSKDNFLLALCEDANQELTKLFDNIYKNLSSSGIFIFDILTDDLDANGSVRIFEKDAMTMFIDINNRHATKRAD